MKGIFFTPRAAFICFALFFAASSAHAVTLTYSTFFPPTHIQAVTSENWCKEVEKRTDGRVKIQFFPGQTLTRAPQTYEAVTDGIADIGVAALAYTQGRFPVMASLDMPLGYPSGVVATKAANALFEKMEPVEFDSTKVMYFHGHGPGYIHTRKVPVKKLEDLKGQRIRSTGMSANIATALGGTPVSMAMPDTYQSLQRGVVDGSFHPAETNKGWNMGEVVSYMTIAKPAAYTTTFYVVMNKSKWNKISPEDQKVIEEINKEWALKHGEAWDSSDEEGMVFFKDKGGTVITLDDAESERWATAVRPVIDNYIKTLDDMKIDGANVFDFINKVIATGDAQ
ncbi:TRAP transporter substrate-binding protein [Desulfopila inferna]|uniref:TRAP transporter substrate-binding protein n=1 Tax=Desulfopila inferna TaxID=468528 RepID=UPI001964F383|nr:TRAP transporter substrate-binding protein [Desulfopila inferna]MBM9603607.1 TRAP transporter substrate-binding protein [Desulfopila inferna]